MMLLMAASLGRIVTGTVANPESENTYVKTLCQDTCDCKCDNGPYVFERGSKNEEGLGSFIQRFRLFILLDMGSEYSWIPRQISPGHMKMKNLHRMWWQDLLGFRNRNVDCNECSLYRRIADGKLQAIVADQELKQFNKKISRQGAMAEKCNLMATKSLDMDFLDNITSNVDPKQLVLTWGMSESHVLQPIEQPACTVTWMEKLYTPQFESDMRLIEMGQPPLVVGRQALPFNTSRHISVAIHYRMGDALKSKRPLQRVGFGGPGLDDEMADILGQLIERTTNKESLYIFITCECDRDSIGTLMDKFESHGVKIIFFQSQHDHHVARDLDLLAHADVMFLSSSSFSVLAAALNPNGIALVLSGSNKYEGWGRERRIHRSAKSRDSFWEAYTEIEASKPRNV